MDEGAACHETLLLDAWVAGFTRNKADRNNASACGAQFGHGGADVGSRFGDWRNGRAVRLERRQIDAGDHAIAHDLAAADEQLFDMLLPRREQEPMAGRRARRARPTTWSNRAPAGQPAHLSRYVPVCRRSRSGHSRTRCAARHAAPGYRTRRFMNNIGKLHLATRPLVLVE